MVTRVRVIDTGHLDAATNMALDEVILEQRRLGSIPDTIRFLSFKPHSVLVGYFQSVENEVRLDYCSENKIDINRRITGGGALYWDENDIGWEFFGSREGMFSSKDFESFNNLFCNAACKGLNKFGLDPSFRPRNDIEISGRKISGTGGTSNGNAFMFQGTLLVDVDIEVMLRALRVPTEKLKYSEISSLKQRMTWLSRELGYRPKRQEIIANLTEGICGYLGLEYYHGVLTEKEKSLLQAKLRHFRSKEHIYRQAGCQDSSNVFSYDKSSKGVIKCSSSIDVKRKVLKNTFFTGDFFVYPKRAIYDLESVLKNINISSKVQLDRTVDGFFKDYSSDIQGIKPGQVKKLLGSGIDKLGLLKHGIGYDQINDIYFVCRPFDPKNVIEILLLPYCSKEPDCEFRYSQGCSKCGLCSIGDAIEVSESFGIKHMTITSFEHLRETLTELRSRGVKYFAGCCCEAFYLKHIQDFENIGLPGVLVNIDSTTCYDLGKEYDAYGGKFEGFTDIKTGLLKKVLALNTGGKDGA